MALNSFSPNTKIKSSEANANFTNLSTHGRNVTLQWLFAGTLTTQESIDIKQVPDAVTWSRCDIVVGTVPTGASIIVDIERSTDNGATWVTIFTGGTNRPVISVSNRAGSTTTVDVPAGTANSHLWRAKVSQVGSTIAGSDLSVMLKGTYNLD